MIKKIILVLIILLGILCVTEYVYAAEESASTQINGITANWEYKINDSNEIEDLVCVNASELTGALQVPSTIDGKTVISLGLNAFENSKITSITIPDTLKDIETYAFSDCTNLTQINWGAGVESLGVGAFEDCTGLTEITIPKTFTGHMGNYPFNGCNNITKVIFEEGITEIPSFICQNLIGIKEITIPNSVTKIDSFAFNACENLERINWGANVESLGVETFGDCVSLTEITIPKTFTGHMGNYPFNGCDNITKVTFEEGITEIPSFICQNLIGIKEITIPNSVTNIGSFAFDGCTSLEKITILDNVKDFEVDVFRNHNENLTIYCYEGSAAAKYAIDNDIKYVYLTRPANDNNEVENNNNGSNNEENNKDNTVAPGKIPQTGQAIISLVTIAIVGIIGIIIHKKNRKMKDIK